MTAPVNPSVTEERSAVLVVEDDPGLSQLLADELTEAGLDVTVTDSAEAAKELMPKIQPALIVSDLRLPGEDGLSLLRHTRAAERAPAFIVITAFGTVPQAVAAVQEGADDFLTKPLDFDRLSLAAKRALETRRLRNRVRYYEALLEGDDFHGILGESQVMRTLFAQIRQIAKAHGPVLILGESGVGKELVARALHEESDRAQGPFRAVNCAGVPEGLLESEFFGHASGAFTGAEKARKGLFFEADQGTLLLDEIGEMPLSLQAKLLRVLQEQKVRPVGADKERSVDVRIVAATHADLEQRVRDRRFREDLFFRLETFSLAVPPLRAREDDIELLTGRFLRRVNLKLNKGVRSVSADALDRLRAYSFPGNVRELASAMERAVAFCQGPVLDVEHLPERIRNRGGPAARANPSPPRVEGATHDDTPALIGSGPLPTLAELEERYIRYVLEAANGNKRRAAALLGIGRRTLYRRLSKGEDVDP